MAASHGHSPPSGRVRLGELLVKAGVITDVQLKTALAEQKQWGGKLGDILVRMRYLSEDIFVRALSKQLGLPRADLAGALPLEALAKVPADAAEEYEIVPVALLDEGKTLAIATSDPLNVTVLDTIRSISKCRITPYVAGASAIRTAIGRLYRGEDLRGDDGGQLQILSNSVDEAPGGRTPAALRPGHTTSGSGLRPAQPPGHPAPFPGTHQGPPTQPYAAQPTPLPVSMQSMQPASAPPAMPPPVPVQQQYQAQLQQQMQAQLQQQQLQAQLQQQLQAQLQQMAAQQLQVAPAPAPAPVVQAQGWSQQGLVDERREAVALKALVELLVQKGVISLDEYLARLKR